MVLNNNKRRKTSDAAAAANAANLPQERDNEAVAAKLAFTNLPHEQLLAIAGYLLKTSRLLLTFQILPCFWLEGEVEWRKRSYYLSYHKTNDHPIFLHSYGRRYEKDDYWKRSCFRFHQN